VVVLKLGGGGELLLLPSITIFERQTAVVETLPKAVHIHSGHMRGCFRSDTQSIPKLILILIAKVDDHCDCRKLTIAEN